MPFDIFSTVLAKTEGVLREHYAHVESPIEAPGKSTYGDVDILITGAFSKEFDPVKTRWNEVADKLMDVLGAKASLRHSGMPIVNLAVPWPGEYEGEDKYVQIDVHHVHSLERFKWELFHHSHGDMWNIIGSTIRRFGLTVNDRGLYLRIPEIELFDRKKSLVFLTESPSEVLKFVGLDEDTWWKQFDSQESMFEYAASCRLFWVREKNEEEAEFDVLGDIANGGQEGGEAGKKKLKHNDRQRMSKRPIFNDWISDFIPRCREAGKFTEQRATREQIRDEAFEKFGVKKEYDERLTAWKLAKHEDELWREVIKGSIPIDDVDPQFRAAAIRLIKGVVMEGQEFEGQLPAAIKKDEDGFYDMAAVKMWVEANWERAGEIGMTRQLERSKQMMKEKEEKKRKLAEEEAKKAEKKV
jgi:hypothetical protein